MSTTSIHVTLPKALKEHIEKRVAEGDFTSPSDYVRALIRAEQAYREKRTALLRDIDAGLEDIDAGRIYSGEEVFAELLGEEEPKPQGMARLTIAAHARADLQEIHSHIAKDNPEAARRFVKRLRDKARQLAETPGMGRNRGEDLRPGLFSFPVGAYVLF